MPEPQNYANHARRPPRLFLVAWFAATAAAASFLFRLFTDFSVETLALFLTAGGASVGIMLARRFAVGVQDRVIRLEERLRMERLLPDDLKGRTDELTTDQLIGLRFASDDELAGLVRRVFAGELTDRKTIKQAVEDWRADHQRV
jgi:hypothetical protein